MTVTSRSGDCKGLCVGVNSTADSIKLIGGNIGNGKCTISRKGSADLLALVEHFVTAAILQAGQQAELKGLGRPIGHGEAGVEVNGDSAGSSSGSCGGSRKSHLGVTSGGSCTVGIAGEGVSKVSSSRDDTGKITLDFVIVSDGASGCRDSVVLKSTKCSRSLQQGEGSQKAYGKGLNR